MEKKCIPIYFPGRGTGLSREVSIVGKACHPPTLKEQTTDETGQKSSILNAKRKVIEGSTKMAGMGKLNWKVGAAAAMTKVRIRVYFIESKEKARS